MSYYSSAQLHPASQAKLKLFFFLSPQCWKEKKAGILHGNVLGGMRIENLSRRNNYGLTILG